MLFCRGVLPYLNGPSFKALDFCLHPLPSAAVLAALPRGHAAIAFVDVGVGLPEAKSNQIATSHYHFKIYINSKFSGMPISTTPPPYTCLIIFMQSL